MTIKLMVVDDEAPVVEVLKAFLEPTGSHVVGLTDSLKAAECVECEKFDGIFLDVKMHPPDGFELTRRTRASFLNCKTPVVLLTGMDDVDTMRRGFRAGATCFIGKPITRDRVQRVVNAMSWAILVERRRNARLPLRTKVECGGGTGHAKCFVAESLNIGEDGMLIQGPVGLTVGEELSLQFQLPQLCRPLRQQGRVVRQEHSGQVAIEFLGSTIGDQEAIRAYIMGGLQG
jgi:CheY-like chemotaxis protein